MTYAQKTEVGADRSRAEIEKTLVRYGAQSFAYGWDSGRAAITFDMRDRKIRFVLPLPNPADRAFSHTPTGQVRAKAAAAREYDQAVRARWRALALIVKAKLEAVESGIVEFESEFLAHTVLPSGNTVAEDILPAIAYAYANGEVAPLQIGSS